MPATSPAAAAKRCVADIALPVRGAIPKVDQFSFIVDLVQKLRKYFTNVLHIAPIIVLHVGAAFFSRSCRGTRHRRQQEDHAALSSHRRSQARRQAGPASCSPVDSRIYPVACGRCSAAPCGSTCWRSAPCHGSGRGCSADDGRRRRRRHALWSRRHGDAGHGDGHWKCDRAPRCGLRHGPAPGGACAQRPGGPCTRRRRCAPCHVGYVASPTRPAPHSL